MDWALDFGDLAEEAIGVEVVDGEWYVDRAEDTVGEHEHKEAQKLSESRDMAGVEGISWAVRFDEAGVEGVSWAVWLDNADGACMSVCMYVSVCV